VDVFSACLSLIVVVFKEPEAIVLHDRDDAFPGEVVEVFVGEVMLAQVDVVKDMKDRNAHEEKAVRYHLVEEVLRLGDMLEGIPERPASYVFGY